ncbi:tryptophan synthase subunit alpha [Persicobacter sp. CCB-QB2]|uniref:tryptophan synthase subunit alpha n=1 Tax=Persicobacter sp. CCB-QB2 TaxID=1561025 RepID=UPI0006A96E0B|nr:tryptophan synthase subunit alpha [Persicobacter sp. CCB-QB2]
MNRINQLFEEKDSNLLNVYFTAGYPNTADTRTVLESLDASGADLIEIGIPFSDPVADGPVIQRSNEKALAQGMSLKLLFEQLDGMREKVKAPVILMGYVNPVIQFGIEEFCKECQRVGVDGIIVPDLPLQAYLDDYKATFDDYGIRNVFLISPQTSEERIRLIDEKTDGFIYMVSDAGTTGARKGISEAQLTYFERIQDMKLKNPRLIGFGISDHDSFSTACNYANGAIIGSAFVNSLSEAEDIPTAITNFVSRVKNG